MNQRERYPLNVDGDFYVENSMCLGCMAPINEAPDLMSYGASADACDSCFFKKQPESSEELERAMSAMAVQCVGAIRYSGTDPRIIKRLSADECDALGTKS